jgi:hypothetical protein
MKGGRFFQIPRRGMVVVVVVQVVVDAAITRGITSRSCGRRGSTRSAYCSRTREFIVVGRRSTVVVVVGSVAVVVAVTVAVQSYVIAVLDDDDAIRKKFQQEMGWSRFSRYP